MHLYPVSVADHLPSVFSLAFLCKNGAVRTALCGFHAARGDWSVYGVRLVSMVKKDRRLAKRDADSLLGTE